MDGNGVKAFFAAVLFVAAVGSYWFLQVPDGAHPGPTPEQIEQQARRARQEEDDMRRYQEETARKMQREWEQKEQTLHDELAKWLSERERWKIPPELVDTHLDLDGQTWFAQYFYNRPEEALRKSVERAAKDQSKLIVNGRMFQRNADGSLWVLDHLGYKLWAFNGTKQTLLRRADDGMPPSSPPSPDPARFKAWFRDSRGHLFMLAYRTSDNAYAVHERSADGSWSCQPIPPPAEGDVPLWEPLFFEQSPGTVLLYRKSFSDPSAYVYRLADGVWKWHDVRRCHRDDVDALIPMKDGSVLTLCSADRLWTWWPEGKQPPSDRQVLKLVQQLSDPDPQVRKQAMDRLKLSCSAAADELLRLRDEVDSPQAARQLAVLIRQLQESDGHGPDGGALAGRLWCKDIQFVAHSPAGGAAFYVAHANDLDTGLHYCNALAKLNADGSWTVAEMPKEQARHLRGVRNGFEDASGNLWIPPGHVIRADGTTVQAFPEGLSFREVRFQDAEGRIYFDSAPKALVLDPAMQSGQSAVAQTEYNAIDFDFVAGATHGWAAEGAFPPTIYQVGAQGKWMPLQRDWDEETCFSWMVALNGGVIVQINSEGDHFAETHLWDGQQWVKEIGLRNLVRSHARRLMKLAPTFFVDDVIDVPPPVYLVSADGEGLWHMDRGGIIVETARTIPPILEYFDGQKWQDALLAIRKAGFPGTVDLICSADRGRTLLLRTGDDQSILALQAKGGEIRVRKLEITSDLSTFALEVVEMPQGGIWISNENSCQTLQDGSLSQASYQVAPLLIDSKGHFWFQGYPGVGVPWQGTMVSARVDGATDGARMVESPDGRVWLLHSKGMSLMEARPDGSGLSVTEKGRWEWNSLRNSYPPLLCDDAGGLWMQGHGRRIIRYQLPATP